MFSFAKLYADIYGGFPPDKFAQRLWGDVWFHHRTFTRKSPKDSSTPRTFVHFVLEPLYKIFGLIVGDIDEKLPALLNELGVTMTKKEMKMNVRPVLKMVLSRFFGPSTGLTDMIRDHIRSPAANAETKVRHTYSGDLDSDLGEAMLRCDPEGPLMVNVTKLYPTADGTVFNAFGRVMSGTIHNNSSVRVLGESYSLDDDEDSKDETVSRLFISEARWGDFTLKMVGTLNVSIRFPVSGTESKLTVFQLAIGCLLRVLIPLLSSLQH